MCISEGTEKNDDIFFGCAINKFVGTHPRMSWCHMACMHIHTDTNKPKRRKISNDDGGGAGYKAKTKKISVFEIQWQTNYEL